MSKSESLVIEGILVLMAQEGGFANDAWYLEGEEDDLFIEQIYNAISNFKINYVRLDDYVADHFKVEYDKMGNRLIGGVRITIEKL